MGLGRFSYSPLIPALIEAGHLSAWQAGAIGASNFAGYLVGALAAPTMRMRWGEAKTMRISLLAGLIALFACALPLGFEWLLFWRALLGAIVGVMMIYCLAIATRHAPSGKLGAVQFAAIAEAAASGEEISLNGFGKFKVKEAAAREGRNPATGATIRIAASKKLTFTPAKAVKDKLNG